VLTALIITKPGNPRSRTGGRSAIADEGPCLHPRPMRFASNLASGACRSRVEFGVPNRSSHDVISAYGNRTEKMYRNGVSQARTKSSAFSTTGTIYGVSRRIPRCQLPPSHGENRGSSPLGSAKEFPSRIRRLAAIFDQCKRCENAPRARTPSGTAAWGAGVTAWDRAKGPASSGAFEGKSPRPAPTLRRLRPSTRRASWRSRASA
jgi:hypothetical protein